MDIAWSCEGLMDVFRLGFFFVLFYILLIIYYLKNNN